MKIYYEIWVDAITKMRSIPRNAGIWKFYSMVFISMGMSLNLVVLLLFLKDISLTDAVFKIPIAFFPGTKIDAFMSFFVSYLLPMLLLNYFLIFHNNRYKALTKKYRSHNGIYFITYFIGSLSLLILYFFIAFLIVKVF